MYGRHYVVNLKYAVATHNRNNVFASKCQIMLEYLLLYRITLTPEDVHCTLMTLSVLVTKEDMENGKRNMTKQH